MNYSNLSKELRIFIIIKFNPYFESSASANRLLTLIEGLNNLGAQVELLIYGGFQSNEEAEAWKIANKQKGIICKYIAPRLIQGYWKRRYYNYIGEKLREGSLLKLILKELDKKEGIVWTDSSHFGFRLAVYLKENLHKKKIFLEMSEYLDIHKYNKGNLLQKWLADKRQKYFERKAFFNYDGLALMTKTLYRHYDAFRKSCPKLMHLPMTVDLNRFNQEFEPVKGFVSPYIAFVGVMNDAKDGVNILIEAFSKIQLQFPDYKLYLVGHWNYDTPSHRQMIGNLGLEQKVFWLGEYKRDAIPAIIKNAELLVLPRPDSKQAQGGFPTKLGEYLATGNPVCATNVGEIPDYLVDGESVYFADPGSVDSFANAMHRALSNPEKAKMIGGNGRKVAETYFNKDIQAKILCDFLKENLQTNNNK